MHCWITVHAFVVVLSHLFQKLTFSKQSFMNTIRVLNGLDPDQDQDRHFVGPDLGRNCLPRLKCIPMYAGWVTFTKNTNRRYTSTTTSKL